MKKLHMVPCVIGLAIVAGFALARGAAALPALGFALLCPIAMIVMMRMMTGDGRDHRAGAGDPAGTEPSQPRSRSSVDH